MFSKYSSVAYLLRRCARLGNNQEIDLRILYPTFGILIIKLCKQVIKLQNFLTPCNEHVEMQ